MKRRTGAEQVWEAARASDSLEGETSPINRHEQSWELSARAPREAK
ncbi:MAG: hypothetical protein JSV78_04935 [Phycisphaerales bacterium]|nr:MAG: hypothetical protein JSV78_04935 [Phycisphaerales bacterium]